MPNTTSKQKPIKEVINQLYHIYSTLNVTEEIEALCRDENPAKPKTTIEAAYLDNRKPQLKRAVALRNDIARLHYLAGEGILNEKDEAEYNETYRRVIGNFTGENAERDFKHHNEIEKATDYKALKYPSMQFVYREAVAFDQAKDMLDIFKIQRKMDKASQLYENCKMDKVQFEKQVEEFAKKYPDTNLTELKGRRDTLDSAIRALEEDYKSKMALEDKRKEMVDNGGKLRKEAEQKEAAEIRARTEKVNAGLNAVAREKAAMQEVERLTDSYKRLTDKFNKASTEAMELENELKLLEKEDVKAYDKEFSVLEEKQNLLIEYNTLVKYKEKYSSTSVFQDKQTVEELIGEFFERNKLEGFDTIPNKKLEEKLKADIAAEENRLKPLKPANMDVIVEKRSRLEAQQLAVKELTARLKNEEAALLNAANKQKAALETLDRVAKELGIKPEGLLEEQKRQNIAFENLKEKVKVNAARQLKEETSLNKEISKQKIKADKLAEMKKQRDGMDAVLNEARKLHSQDKKIREAYSYFTMPNNNKLVSEAQKIVADRAEILIVNQIEVKGHKNSREYEDMLNCLDAVKNATDIKDRNEALDKLVKDAESYLEAKENQWRPFPSATRQARIAFAQSIVDFAECSKKALELVPEVKSKALDDKITNVKKNGDDALLSEDEFFKKCDDKIKEFAEKEKSADEFQV